MTDDDTPDGRRPEDAPAAPTEADAASEDAREPEDDVLDGDLEYDLGDEDEDFEDDEDFDGEDEDGEADDEEDAEGPTRAGFIAVLGAPNAGKSTLVNTIVGAKVTIVSPKVQTTRSIVRGIAMKGQTQLIFVDTPGIFEPKKRMERAMVSAAWNGAQDADQVLLVVDSRRGFSDDVKRIVDGLGRTKRQAILALNKVDAIERPKLLALAQELYETSVFSEVFMISALTGSGVKDLVRLLAKRMPESPWLFPEDEISDLPQRLLAAEITREKLFLNLHQELPYAVTIHTEGWEERKDGSVRIDQTIFVMRESQRSIVLGKQGRQIKAIGAASREELEALLERRVHLFLHVKVKEDWAERRDTYAEWGLDFDS
ncbi:GTPase Era [Caenispirillum bisanense]|uniref:GTPase Era n=1 Tax=Caenispirillum bisanense TaxID=414052 RepID=A0A286GFN7_9PROT|nr:GTPase Era [Caenispirillum bisanense]SOD94337.1 GTP-binding protein Era [Caenispirillum bisanense]